MRRRFVESAGFSADRLRLERTGELVLEDMVALEQSILANAHVGDLVRGTGGLRKVRLGQRAVGRGKRGGVRVYYLDLPERSVTHLVVPSSGSGRKMTSPQVSAVQSPRWSAP